MKNQIKNRLKKAALITGIIFMQSVPMIAQASIEKSKIFTGSEKLLNDLTKALVGISIVVGGCAEVFLYVKLSNAEDEEVRGIKKKQKTTLYATIACVLVSSVLNIIVGYYK